MRKFTCFKWGNISIPFTFLAGRKYIKKKKTSFVYVHKTGDVLLNQYCDQYEDI